MKYILTRENLSKNWEPKFKIEEVLDSIEIGDWYDLYPGYSREIDEDEECYFSTKDKAIQYANEVIDIFTSLPNPIPIYRSLKVKSKEDIDYEFLGESWSYRKESAINFGKRIGANVLLSAFVYKKDVEWGATLRVYHVFSGGYTDEDEDEIVIDDNSAIFNVKVEDM